LKKTNIHI
jgi:hypothetical protein